MHESMQYNTNVDLIINIDLHTWSSIERCLPGNFIDRNIFVFS